MGLNFKSHRIREAKAKLERMTLQTPLLFTKQIALLESLMSIETISVRNAQWARKYVVERMRPIYLDQGSVDIMNEFEKRFAAAEQRRIRRREKKLALKAEGATTGTSSTRGRKLKGAPPQAPVVLPYDPAGVWAEMLEEKKS
jgi:uncharacterized protein YecE (DUF72 family)